MCFESILESLSYGCFGCFIFFSFITDIPLAFTHCPGSMFVTDNPSEQGCEKSLSSDDLLRVVWLSHDPPLASALSQEAEAVIQRLEVIASDDPGCSTSLFFDFK